jgi:hypothetical protein
MPIEIRELNIRVSVAQDQPEQDSAASGQQGFGQLTDKEELIAECVEQVMELLKLKTER